MKKKVILFGIFIFSILILSQARAEDDYKEKINKGFECLEEQIRKTSSLTLQQGTFSMLAGAETNRAKNSVNGMKKSGEECWPKEGCRVKETAQVALAFKKQNIDNKKIIDWLKNQTTIPRDLIWYLQIIIDDGKPATCNVGYDGRDYEVNLDEDYMMSIPNGLGNCLAYESGLLRIAQNCVEKKFTISCSGGDFQSFKTGFFFKVQGEEKIRVSSQTQSSDKGALQVREITAKCFKKEPSSTGCDYESGLWAVTALFDKGEEIEDYMGYLKELSDKNAKYFPEAFLINFVGVRDEYFTRIIEKRISGHWDVSGSPYSKFYDTSLAIIGLGGLEAQEVNNGGTLKYLFETDEQTTEGCWNSNDISDTALLLYALGEGKSSGGGGSSGGGPVTFPSGSVCEDINGTCRLNCTGTEEIVDAECDNDAEMCCYIFDSESSDGTDTQTTDCEEAGYYCAPSLVDCLSAGGIVEEQYNCAVFANRCCTEEVSKIVGCSELGGKICKSEERCSSSLVETSDGACCLDVCQTSGQESETGTDVPAETAEGGSNLWTIMIILIILIILVVIGIIFRDKIRIWWLKRSGKTKTSKFPPPGVSPQSFFRPLPPPRFGQPIRRPMMRSTPISRQVSGNEMEETLKKLKKMSEE